MLEHFTQASHSRASIPGLHSACNLICSVGQVPRAAWATWWYCATAGNRNWLAQQPCAFHPSSIGLMLPLKGGTRHASLA